MKTTDLLLLTVVWCLGLGSLCGADPVVSNVRAVQRPGTQLVEIVYDVADSDSATLTVSVAVSDTGGATYAVPASSFTGDLGNGVTPGTNRRIVWDAGRDWPGKFSANMRFLVTAQDAAPAPTGMALIPAGSFEMGDTIGGGWSDERPVHTVSVSAFYMDRTEMTKGLWDEVYVWATAHGYSFDYAGSGKGVNHPVHSITWYDVVKWGAGYRLPTEAQWEYAVRGGLEREAISVGGHDQPQPGELLQLLGRRQAVLQLRGIANGGVSSDVRHGGLSLHESGGVVWCEQVWFRRHGRERVGVVLGLVRGRILEHVAG